jgi:AAA family ATP:ADP antiporter
MDNFFTQFADFALIWYWLLLLILVGLFANQMSRIPVAHRKFTAVMALYFFLVIVAYWILKPIKKALFIGYYKLHGGLYDLAPAQMELLAKETNILLALAMSLMLVWLRRRFSATGFGLSVTLLFALGLAILIPFAKQPSEVVVWSLYLYGDMFASSLVALFFVTLHDRSSVEDTRRIYGLVGMGGVLGGLAGSILSGSLDRLVGVQGAMATSCAMTLCVAAIGWLIARHARTPHFGRRSTDGSNTHTNDDLFDGSKTIIEARPLLLHGNGGLFDGAKAILHSRPLLLIAAILFLYEITSVVLDYQFTSAVSREVSADKLKQYFSAVYTFSNSMAVLVQLLLTTWVMRKHSLRLALLVMPLAIMLGESAYMLAPALLTASLLNTVDSAFAYSIQQTAREALYVPLSRHEKYEAKAFIDIVWLRFSKGIAVVLSLALSLLIPTSGELIPTGGVQLGIGGMKFAVGGMELAAGVVTLVLVWIWLLKKVPRQDEISREPVPKPVPPD